MKKNYSQFIICIFFIKASYFQAQVEYGLNFKSQNEFPDNRTGFYFVPKKPVVIYNDFELSFDIKSNFNQQETLFGYIFRLLDSNGQNLDLLISNENSKRKLNLVIGKTGKLVTLDQFYTFSGNWVNIKINIFPSKKKIILTNDKQQFIIENVNIEFSNSFKLFFGKNDFAEFASSDVPKISIRDIKISKENKLLYHFPLDECGGNVSVDIVSREIAKIENPIWLICNHKKWKLDFESQIEGIQLLAVNENQSLFYFIQENGIKVYSLADHSVKTIKYKSKLINLTIDHRAVLNENTNEIYCYLPDKKIFSVFDIKNEVWNNRDVFSEFEHLQEFQNHTSVFSREDNSIYLFGGYGQYKYNNKISRINLSTTNWESLITNDIFKPRYLLGSTILNDSIYLLGGYGNSSGNQLVNPKGFNNLLSYSIKNGKIIEKNRIKELSEDAVVSSSIVVDSLKRNFYALIYNKNKFDGSLRLLKGHLEKDKSEILADSIPYNFIDTKSFSSIYNFPKLNKMVAYTSYLTSKNITKFKIYSISNPAITNIKSDVVIDKTTLKTNYLIEICLLASIIIVGLVLFYRKNYAKNNLVVEKESEFKSEIKIETKDVEESYVLETLNLDSNKKNQIIFFGGFQIIDKYNQDITSKFTPLLKELFLLIWLNTFKNNKGISSNKLTDILWYDKSSKRAQNNRSVNLTKLRNILKNVEGCEITKDTGYWKILHNYQVLSNDYYELIHIAHKDYKIDKKVVDHLINITKRGSFLLNLQYEWLDEFKADISNRTINTLVKFSSNFNIEEDPSFIINLSNCIFNFDSINEEAMILKCKAQYLMGKHSLAESTFKKFKNEYKILYDQDFEYSFTEILNKD